MRTAPRREPAVLPIGRNGNEGKTARTQKTANAMEPKITLTSGAMAITTSSSVASACTYFLGMYIREGHMLMAFIRNLFIYLVSFCLYN